MAELPLSLFHCTPFPPIPAERRGRHSGGGTEDRSCFQQTLDLLFFLCLFFSCSFPYVYSFCLTFLRSVFWLVLCDQYSFTAQQGVKSSTVSHTFIHTHSHFISVPLPLPESRGEVAPLLRHTVTGRFCLIKCSYFIKTFPG